MDNALVRLCVHSIPMYLLQLKSDIITCKIVTLGMVYKSDDNYLHKQPDYR